MDVELLKQGLKEILNEDISIRTSIADLRRNVFLQSSKAEETEAKVRIKEEKITELASEVDYIKNQLSIREQSLRDELVSAENEKADLLQKLSERENEINDLRTEIENLSADKAEFRKKSEEFNRLSLENSNYAAKIRELVGHIAKIQEEQEANALQLADLKAKNSKGGQSEQEIISLKKEIEKLNATLLSLESSNSKLEAELKNYSQENEAYGIRNAELVSRNAELESSSNELISRNGILEAENSELKSLNSELQESNFEFINLHAHLKLTTEETIDVLRSEIAELEQTSAERIEQLQNEVSAAKNDSEAEELSALLEISETENKELKAIVEALRVVEQNYITARQRIAELETAISEISVLRDAADEADALRAKVEILDEEIVRLNAVISDLDAQLESKQSDFELLVENRTKENKEQVSSLISQLDSLRTASELNNETIGILNSQISELESELAELRENERNSELLAQEISQLTTEMNVHLKAVSELEEKNAGLNKEMAAQTAAAAQVIAERESLLAECERLKMELAGAEEMYNRLMDESRSENEKEIEALKIENAEIEELRMRVEELKAENDHLLAAGSVDIGSDKKLAELQLLADELNSEKLRLEETITDLKRELFKAEEKLEKQEEAAGEQNDEFIEGLFKKIDLLNEKTQKLQHQKEEIELQVPELLEKIAELSERIDSQKNNQGKNTGEGLEKANNSPNLAGMLADTIKDKKAAKMKINELVREIDRCIAMLNAQS